MGRRGLAISVGLAWLAAAGAAQAADDVLELTPTAPWHVHYADDYCRLARIFGTDEQKIIFSIEQDAPGDSFRMTLTGPMLDGPTRKGKASITFGAMPEQQIMFFPGTVGEGQPAWIFGDSARIKPYSAEKIASADDQGIRYEPITEAEEAAVTSVTIGRPLRDPVRLKTGPMKAAFAAMRSCTDELLDHWSIDVARHRELSRWATPIGNPAKWLRSGDYPRAMLTKWQPGIVRFRLSVGADGTPTACHIQRSTNSEGFDDAVCKGVMRRARFEPALDKDGRPIASYYVNVVRFQF
ncbi:TonB family protein [Sphingopyxis italica]|uniref:TonB family protein n=1 Tax=Sphingopyxis italica TaxID=1129133 RepID=A0A7X5XUA5_9SPHN|nr:energy transducer TonB [Sphingopyxis italica]NJB91094.1 TonB family protein [Sphingopyxis italica]